MDLGTLPADHGLLAQETMPYVIIMRCATTVPLLITHNHFAHVIRYVSLRGSHDTQCIPRKTS